MNIMRQLIVSVLVAVLAGCTGVPDGVTVVDGFELEGYLGTWHEIARLDHSFERGLSQVTAGKMYRNLMIFFVGIHGDIC